MVMVLLAGVFTVTSLAVSICRGRRELQRMSSA
jgi:hypothetical protein